MATLPDRTVFGNAPSGLSGRPGVDYSGAVAPGRQNIETASRSGEGMKALGRGLEVAGEHALRYAAAEGEKEDALSLTEAKTTALINSSNLTESLGNENDPKHISQVYPEAYQNAFAVSAQNLSPGARKEYDLWAATHINHGMQQINGRVQGLEKDQGLATLDGQLKSLGEAGIKQGSPDKAGDYIKQAGEQIDAAVGRGWMTSEHAFKLKEQWAHNFSAGKIMSLPPDERLRVLGGVVPGTVATTDVSVSDKALLNAIAGPESSGKYNVRYGGTFSDFSRHPNVAAAITEGPNAGKTSTAAGRYQFIKGTWDRAAGALGLTDFSPASQDKAALWLAKTEYKRLTGREMDADIQKNGGLTEGMLDTLATKNGGQWEGFDSRAGKAKALAAYHATTTGKVDTGYHAEISDNPLVSSLPMDTRHSMVVQSANDYMQEHQQRQLGVEQARADVRQKMQDDQSALLSTGKATDLTTDQVRGVFGDEQAKHFQAEREIAQTYYTQTNDFSQIPAEEIAKRIEQMRPSEENADTPGFKLRKTLYDRAVKEATTQIKERNLDPAAAADRIPEVAAAKQKAELGGDDNAKRELARARMRGFDMLGIPASRQIPMTRQEAKDLVAPVTEALSDKETRAALEGVTKQIQSIYGDDMTSRVLGFALNAARADQDTTEAAARVIKRLFKKPETPVPPDAADQEVKQAAEVDAMAKFVDPSPNFGGFSSPDAWAASEQNKPAAKRYPVPNNDAVKALIGQPTPERAAQFDAMFGPGSAAKLMKQAGVETQEQKRPVSPALLGGNS